LEDVILRGGRHQVTVAQDGGRGGVLVVARVGEVAAQVVGVFDVENVVAVDVSVHGALVEPVALLGDREVEARLVAAAFAELGRVLLGDRQAGGVRPRGVQRREGYRVVVGELPVRPRVAVEVVDLDRVEPARGAAAASR
jgi:hypothetical protein